MPRFLIIFVFALFFPQNEGCFQILNIAEKAAIIDVDDLGNIYTTFDGQLKMFNPGGKQMLIFDDRKTGKISAIDIKNPDRVLVFYKERYKIRILDGLFKQWAEVNLTAEAGLFDVTLACLSADENIWVYSNNEKKLMKISDKGDFITKSAIVDDITGTKTQPVFLREYNQKIYLNIPRTGILEFDNQANFIRIIPLKGLVNFCVADGKICYVSGRNLKVYDIGSGMEQITRLPDLTYISTMPDLHGNELLLYYADLNNVGVLSIPANQK